MAFFLLIQANDMEQTAVPLPRATNPHGQHSEGFPREGFPSSSQGGWQQSSAIPTSVPSKAPPCPCPQAVVTPWDSTESDWVVAVVPAITPCIPGAAPASARGLQQGKAALDPSGFTTRALITGGCTHSTWGLHCHALPAFPLCFAFLFNQPKSLLGASTPTIEVGGSGEGGGCLAPMFYRLPWGSSRV